MSPRSDEEDLDELDDLDDYLDEFAEQVLSKPPGADPKVEEVQSKSIGSSEQKTRLNNPATADLAIATGTPPLAATTTSTTNTGNATTNTNTTVDGTATKFEDPNPELDEEFAEKLKLGVDYLLGEMEDSPEAKQSLAALLSGMADATGGAHETLSGKDSSSLPGNQSKAPQQSDDFQDTIAATMNRLKESKLDLDNQADSETDFLAKMMKELETAAGSDGNGIEALLGDLLQELASKDILYEPIKEMHEKYPKWIENNESTLSEDDLTRYRTQQRIVAEIVAKFDDPNYTDQDAECRTYITSRMEEMQNTGSAPMELMSDMSSGSIPGLDSLAGGAGPGGPGGLPKDLEDCAIQRKTLQLPDYLFI